MTPLDQLLDGVIGALVELRVPPTGGHPEVGGVAILDPEDEFRDHHGELVLVVGARGVAALPPLRAAAASGAVAVAVKSGPAAGERPLARAARQLGVALLSVRAQARWDQLAALLRERLDLAELDRATLPGAPDSGAELFELAQATAAVTGGIVSIEDAGDRVLAYSRSDDQVDELRRLSILGWRGPENYLAMLREWGVFDRLRAGGQVVRVQAHPELGIRPRLAIGIRAGPRYLGALWVQQGAAPFTERAEHGLVGSARLAAAELLRRRTGAGPQQLLLTGPANTDLIAGRLGLDPAVSALVVGFGGSVEADPPVRELHRDQVRSVVSVYATAYHRSALVAVHSDRVYAVLPGVAAVRPDPAVRAWAAAAAEVARTRTGAYWWAAVGSPVAGLAALGRARIEVDRVLDVLRRTGRASTATLSELRGELLLGEVGDLLATRPELRTPGVVALLARDERRGSRLAGSLLAYLDALGDVASAAAALHVHPNTLRHRLRRARELSGLDLDDPRERLCCHLQLLCAGGLSQPSPSPARAPRSRPRPVPGPAG